MSERVRAEVADLRDAFALAENRGDPTVQRAHRADDFVRMPPERPPLDREEADRALERLYESVDFDVTWESDGVLASGDLAVDSGQFTVRWATEDECRRGSWLMVFRRTADGEWEVVRDIYNWDEPAD